MSTSGCDPRFLATTVIVVYHVLELKSIPSIVESLQEGHYMGDVLDFPPNLSCSRSPHDLTSYRLKTLRYFYPLAKCHTDAVT